MRKLIYLAALALPLMALAVACQQPDSTPTAKKEPAPAVPPIPVSVKEIDVDSLDAFVKQDKGQVVLMDFWATWCPPCRRTFPHFVALHKKYADKGLLCISVSVNKISPNTPYNKDEVFAFLLEKDATFPNFIAEPPYGAYHAPFALEDAVPHKVMFTRAGIRLNVTYWEDDELARRIENELGLGK